MAFTRIKRIKGIPYAYRVESKRVGGKVVQRVLAYLGRVGERTSRGKVAAPNLPKTKVPKKKPVRRRRKRKK
ncbi:hypothetical protein HY995_05800 [Candidatus Micrarchaeota archaeon]|nr:hypothetical protein [Candidatus Micrarchaeota archaeon]MBI5177567.1 hypothetical protein [Candidatus Micrarchaeota archaeon]